MGPFYVYILTNQHKTVLYTGVTRDIERRLCEHRESDASTFCGLNRTYHLIHLESFEMLIDAIAREKFIKGKRRSWKEALISKSNPEWRFLG
jgi:putative endonuclease